MLRQAAALVNKNAGGSIPTFEDQVIGWRNDLRVYRDRTSVLSPEEAARQWLALFDQALHLPGPLNDFVGSGDQTSHLTDLFRVLPPPTTWDALDAQVARRPEAAKGSSDLSTPVLRIVTGTLRDHPDTVRQAIEAFWRQVEAEDNPEREQNRETVRDLQRIFDEATIDTAGNLRELEAELARFEAPAPSAAPVSAPPDPRPASLELPDLGGARGRTTVGGPVVAGFRPAVCDGPHRRRTDPGAGA